MSNKTNTDEAKVKVSILAFIAYRNLAHKKLRTAITVFGIAIGIGSIFFLLSFGIGLQQLVTNEVIGNQSIKTIDVTSSSSKIIKLDDISLQRIAAVPNVSQIGKAYYFPGSFKVSNSESDSIVYGIDSGYEDLTYLNVIEGTLLGKAGGKDNVVVNKAALEAIGLSKNPKEMIGKSIELVIPLSKDGKKAGNITKPFKVVGVIDSGSGSEVFIPSSIFKEAGVSEVTQLKIGAKDVADISKIRAQVESIGFETTSPADTLDEINKVFRFLNFILVGFGGIGMIVAVLGMFNTLTVSLLERTKEIGLMVALGARSVDMKRLFILEALFLSLLGSVVGIFSAFALGRVVNITMNIFAAKRGVRDSFELFSTPPLLIIAMLVFMTFVGWLVVLLPAKRAQKINPIDALRRE